MKRKKLTLVLIVTFLVGITALGWTPNLMAGDIWDRISTRQSDLMYKYSSSFWDPTKYWNPIYTINQSSYPTISDLTYKYTTPSMNLNYSTPSDLNLKYMDMLPPSFTTYKYAMPSMNLRYITPPDLNQKYMDILPPSWSQRYSLPPLSQSYTYIHTLMVSERYSLPPVAQDFNPIAIPPPQREQFRLPPLKQSYSQNRINRTDINHITNMMTRVHQDLSIIAAAWDYVHPIQRETQLMWDFSHSPMRIIPENPLPTTTPLRTVRNVGLDVLGLTPAIIRDVSDVRQGTYRWFTSHTMETGAFLLLSKAQKQIGFPLRAVGEFTKGISSQMGRGKLVPNIDEMTSYLDALNMASWYAYGVRVGGPRVGSLLSTAADIIAKRGRDLTMPIFQAWADQSVYHQDLESLKILNTARVANGLSALSYESVYGLPRFNTLNLFRWNTAFNWNYQMSNFSRNLYTPPSHYGRW